jgi:hypothetical protein
VINDRPLDVGRNTWEGDNYKRVDLRVARGFRLGGSREIQFVADAFNVLNTTNFTNYNTVWGNGAYPASPNATFGRPTVADDPRIVQFGLRFTY